MISLGEWKEKCKVEQENLGALLGNRVWDEFICPDDEPILDYKIAVLMYGLQRKPGDVFGLNKEEDDFVKAIRRKCLDNSVNKKSVCIGVLFINVYKSGAQPYNCVVLRVRSCATDNYKAIPGNTFIDHKAKVYSNWNAYLKNNKLVCDCFCVPKNGYYTLNGEAEFIIQPPGNWADSVDRITDISLAAGMLLSYYPPTAVAARVAVSIIEYVKTVKSLYDFLHSFYKLKDNWDHKESLTTTEARATWLASLLSLGVFGAEKYLGRTARSGGLPSTTVRAFVNALKGLDLSHTGYNLVKLFEELSQKEKVDWQEKAQCIALSIIFFHSSMSFQTAEKVIQEAQNAKMSAMREKLTEHAQRKFDADHAEARDGAGCEMSGNQIFIKQLKKIKNLEDFYEN